MGICHFKRMFEFSKNGRRPVKSVTVFGRTIPTNLRRPSTKIGSQCKPFGWTNTKNSCWKGHGSCEKKGKKNIYKKYHSDLQYSADIAKFLANFLKWIVKKRGQKLILGDIFIKRLMTIFMYFAFITFFD